MNSSATGDTGGSSGAPTSGGVVATASVPAEAANPDPAISPTMTGIRLRRPRFNTSTPFDDVPQDRTTCERCHSPLHSPARKCRPQTGQERGRAELPRCRSHCRRRSGLVLFGVVVRCDLRLLPVVSHDRTADVVNCMDERGVHRAVQHIRRLHQRTVTRKAGRTGYSRRLPRGRHRGRDNGYVDGISGCMSSVTVKPSAWAVSDVERPPSDERHRCASRA